MSRKLTEKIIEAGIVPAQAVKLMKMWGSLDEDLPETAKQERTENELLAFVGEIGRLLAESQEIPEVKESIPDIKKLFEEKTLDALVTTPNSVKTRLNMVVDRLGHFIFRAEGSAQELFLRRGSDVEVEGARHTIEEVCPIYEDDTPKYFMCTVCGGPHAEMPRMS